MFFLLCSIDSRCANGFPSSYSRINLRNTPITYTNSEITPIKHQKNLLCDGKEVSAISYIILCILLVGFNFDQNYIFSILKFATFKLNSNKSGCSGLMSLFFFICRTQKKVWLAKSLISFPPTLVDSRKKFYFPFLLPSRTILSL